MNQNTIQIKYTGSNSQLLEDFTHNVNHISEYLLSEGLSLKNSVVIHLTDSYEKDVKASSEKSGKGEGITEAIRGEVSTSKIIPNEDTFDIFFRAPSDAIILTHHIDYIFSHLLYCTEIVQMYNQMVYFRHQSYEMNDFEKGIRNLVRNWVQQLWIRRKIETISFFRQGESPKSTEALSAVDFWAQDDFERSTNNFRHRIVQAHFQNSEFQDIGALQLTIGNEIDIFLRQVIRKYAYDGKLDIYSDLQIILHNILDPLNNFLDGSDNKIQYDSSTSQDAILNLYQACGLNPLKLGDKPQILFPNSDPRSIFKNTYIGSVPSIVAFIDILGFSEHISEHTENTQSDILRTLKKALDVTMNNSIKLYSSSASHFTEELSKVLSGVIEYKIEDYLEYRMFSDCLCISNKYTENDIIFLSELLKILTLSSHYQYVLMTNGFFARGGLSLGSYYSDPNMIFSDALVNAYLLENKVSKYPRIVLHQNILIRISESQLAMEVLEAYKNSAIWDKLLVRDNRTKLVFVNPFYCYLHADKSINPALYSRIDIISELIQINRAENKSNRSVFVKYLWLEKLLGWFITEDKMNSRFEYVSFDELFIKQAIQQSSSTQENI